MEETARVKCNMVVEFSKKMLDNKGIYIVGDLKYNFKILWKT